MGSAITPDNAPDSLARTGAYTVTGSENCTVPKPDLTITSSDLTVSKQKGSVVVVATVRNAGTADASGVQVRFTANGVQIGNVQTIPSIASGSSGRASVVWKAKKGNYTVAATADPANLIDELDEANNSGSQVVNVK